MGPIGGARAGEAAAARPKQTWRRPPRPSGRGARGNRRPLGAPRPGFEARTTLPEGSSSAVFFLRWCQPLFPSRRRFHPWPRATGCWLESSLQPQRERRCPQDRAGCAWVQGGRRASVHSPTAEVCTWSVCSSGSLLLGRKGPLLVRTQSGRQGPSQAVQRGEFNKGTCYKGPGATPSFCPSRPYHGAVSFI